MISVEKDTILSNTCIMDNPIIEKKSGTKFLPIFLIIIACASLFGMAGFYLGLKRVTCPDSKTAGTNPVVTTKATNKDYLSELLEVVQADGFKSVEDKPMLWVVDGDLGDWMVRINNTQSIGAYLKLGDKSARSDLLESSSQKYTPTYEKVSAISNYFTENGFTLNKLNITSDPENTEGQDLIQSFENENTICSIIVSSELSSNGELGQHNDILVSCAGKKDMETSYSEQIPFLLALNQKNVAINITKKAENAAIADYGGRKAGGGFALFTKTKEGWINIYAGQNQPGCDILEKYLFPVELYNQCYEEGTSTDFTLCTGNLIEDKEVGFSITCPRGLRFYTWKNILHSDWPESHNKREKQIFLCESEINTERGHSYNRCDSAGIMIWANGNGWGGGCDPINQSTILFNGKDRFMCLGTDSFGGLGTESTGNYKSSFLIEGSFSETFTKENAFKVLASFKTL